MERRIRREMGLNPPLATVNLPLAKSEERQVYFRVTKPDRLPNGKKAPPDCICVEGQDLLDSIPLPSANPPSGTLLSNLYLNPTYFADTRLSHFGAIYEQYLFEEMAFHFQPVQPATISGSVVLAYDRDIADPTPPASLQGYKQYLAMEGSKVTNIWSPATIRCPLLADIPPLWTNSSEDTAADDRLTFQGQFYLAVGNQIGLASGSVGSVWIQYKCWFFVPSLEPAVSTVFTTNSGGTVPIAGDALRQFVPGATGIQLSTSDLLSLRPRFDPLGVAYIPMSQGVYRIVQSIAQSGAGSIAYASPTIVNNNPADPPYWTRQLNGAPSTAANSGAFVDQIIGVPRDGAQFRQGLTTLTATPVGSNLSILRLADYTPNSVMYF